MAETQMQCTFEQIVELVKDNKYHYSGHAEERMVERGITDAQVRETIFTGEVLEVYVEDQRGWSYLVSDFLKVNLFMCKLDTTDTEGWLLSLLCISLSCPNGFPQGKEGTNDESARTYAMLFL